MILASIRLDDIESEIKKMLKDEIINVADGANTIIIRAGRVSSKETYIQSSIHIPQVPWKITSFNPFFTLKKDGSGLGLTVCKRIIDTYGGNIVIDSTVNKGTTVEISLPLDTETKTA